MQLLYVSSDLSLGCLVHFFGGVVVCYTARVFNFAFFSSENCSKCKLDC